MFWSRHSEIRMFWPASVETNLPCWHWKLPVNTRGSSLIAWKRTLSGRVPASLVIGCRSVWGWGGSIRSALSRFENSWTKRIKLCTNRKESGPDSWGTRCSACRNWNGSPQFVTTWDVVRDTASRDGLVRDREGGRGGDNRRKANSGGEARAAQGHSLQLIPASHRPDPKTAILECEVKECFCARSVCLC